MFQLKRTACTDHDIPGVTRDFLSLFTEKAKVPVPFWGMTNVR